MRYPLQGRVSFWWKDPGGDWRQGEGTSRDISETGAFVLAPTCPPVGADVELRISLVASLANVTSTVRMELAGLVLRVDQTTARRAGSGFAVLTQSAIFRENDESTGEGNPGGYEGT